MKNTDNINQLTAHLFRENSGKMTAVLSRMFGLGQIDIVLDVVQDTFETALTKWRFSGIPDNPSAWLMQVAKNKALNTFKRESKTQAYPASVYLKQFDKSIENQFDILLSSKEIKDSQLRLLFTCCHPDFSIKNQIIVTLNILCGFGVPEIANALLMKEDAVKKALARGKSSLRKMGHILQTGIITLSGERIKTIQAIIYLMFNEGYKTTRSEVAINNDLCYEALRLAKLLENNNCAVQSETHALMALMFFNISRFPARLGTSDEWITLEEQDRGLWNKVLIEEGYYYLNKATQSKSISPYHIEAIIASLHCAAPDFASTEWEKIVYLYLQLEYIAPSPLVRLNRIIAESYLNSPINIVQALDELSANAELKTKILVPAVKGDYYKRTGDLKNARLFYEQAFELSVSPFDKKFFKKKILQCN